MKIIERHEGVVFDLDGVITDTAHYHYLGWKKLADGLGIQFDEVENEKLKGVDRMASLEHILKLGDISIPEAQKVQLASEKNEYYQSYIKDITEKDILSGVIEVLDWLKSKNKKIAIASASQNANTIIEGLGLAKYFDHVANAALARSKPEPDIFLFAAYALDLPANKCVGFEDSVAGLKAIKSCSMYAVGVGEEYLATYADYLVPDMNHALPFLNSD